jgi:hypothetical protein
MYDQDLTPESNEKIKMVWFRLDVIIPTHPEVIFNQTQRGILMRFSQYKNIKYYFIIFINIH